LNAYSNPSLNIYKLHSKVNK